MNLYVGNLDYDTTEDDLRQAFAAYGQISSVKIIKDRDTFRSRGFGFVEIPNKAQAMQAIEELNGSQLGNNAITVNEAKPKNNQSKSGFSKKPRSW